jgi:hypothetical protein
MSNVRRRAVVLFEMPPPANMSVFVPCRAGVHEYTHEDGQETFTFQIEFARDRAFTISLNTKGAYGDGWALTVNRWRGSGESPCLECKITEAEAKHFRFEAEIACGKRQDPWEE